ncbi:MAG: alpha-ketoglutarate decarboxylase [Deltaproteobacteria bacterium RIFOXYA12_FULL_58_15]|nr:MAG: alpha-ketoglutarate decarboxylase [Deltaproteobacteria bacterium RIFOXYA12_FULL_58_15]OGR13408.1 MAG: alpha-ketoglutarate decarboxylase [Deltaproteobacteria bacterium RIFOXYB12_FULL_58_9]
MTNLGANSGFVDDLFARYRDDPSSVSDVWRDFFADYEPRVGHAVLQTVSDGQEVLAGAVVFEQQNQGSAQAAIDGAPVSSRAQVPQETRTSDVDLTGADLIVGAAARIVQNMDQSLAMPTATSVRTIAVKLLDENRRLINQHQVAISGPKISFTHLIAWSIVRALEKHPVMNAELLGADGKHYIRRREDINLGLAVDVEKRGQRLLVVPCVKAAQDLSFLELVERHDDLARRARQNKLGVDDLTGTTVTLTNPGMLGTAMSVPRLMQGQGTIIGVGRIDYPAEYSGMAQRVISELGLSKVMTVTSTYDHRIIQGAESGSFLADLETLILGGEGFYERIFADLGVPHEPLAWAPDQNPSITGGADSREVITKQASVLQLIRAYRVRGHLWADLNPLGYAPQAQAELELSTWGLSVWDLDREFVAGGLRGHNGLMTLRRILDILRESYCRHIGVEYMHIPEQETRSWLQERVEGDPEAIGPQERQRILEKLNAAEAFEAFLHTAYLGQKRFSLEGGEVLIPMLDALLNAAVAGGVEEAVIGMAHRGRLNVLTSIIGKSIGSIFREFEGELDPAFSHGSGDVKYHVGASGVHTAPSGETMRVALASNPSHLEAVDPVVEGMARARQSQLGDVERQRVLPILVHGDAAFSGQGVVPETLNLSQLAGYRTGGTIHIVVNNQIGFTTSPEHLRSSIYATDVAKGVRAPIFHVNGDHPEDVARVIKLAYAFRKTFKHDVVVDVVCYRRWGHNEADDPSYTSPTLYAAIKAKRSVRKLYTEELLRRGVIDPQTAEHTLNDFKSRLQRAHDEVKRAKENVEAGKSIVPPDYPEAPPAEPAIRTAASAVRLEEVLAGLDRLPEEFEAHPKLLAQLSRRRDKYDGNKIDWALAEALAFGSLVLEGTPVRLSGEDSGRGTFSQRHAILHDHRNDNRYIPLQHLHDDQAAFNVYDSQLSEFAVLGFEYGFSVSSPETLVMWEAQFGDFANGAQVILDQFLSSAEDKWGQESGLVLLLPHGYEGQGPEHSSARIERFLQLCAAGNLRVCNPSTPAQYFHFLRYQAKVIRRVPMVVFTPKSLLRHPQAVSTAEEIKDGELLTVADDPAVPEPERVGRLVLCSGKVFYDLSAMRDKEGLGDVAIVRIEQLYPVPEERLAGVLRHYPNATDVVWAQEEPENMGAWRFLREHIRDALAPGQELWFSGRDESASPATGSSKRHVEQQEHLIRKALAVD